MLEVMRKVIYSLVLITILLYSCSSDDSETQENVPNSELTEEEVNNNQNDNDENSEIALGTFNFVANEEKVNFENQGVVRRSGDDFSLLISGLSNKSFSISFHKKGNYGNVIFIPGEEDADGFTIDYQGTFNFLESEFSFEIKNITANSVSGIFSGKLVDDAFDPQNSINVSGSFNLPVLDVDPIIEGIEQSAMIGNQEWYATNEFTSGSGVALTMKALNYNNNTAYALSVVFNGNNITTGNFNFNNDTTFNKVQLFKYSSPKEFVEYEIVGIGQLTIESVTDLLTFFLFEGSFSFKARNPNTGEVIEVKSIKLKSIITK